MSVDLLLSCEVVLANGDIVTASDSENDDLFWALRGAGTNFGVVTSFTSRAFPQGKVWGGVLLWPDFGLLDELVAFINKYGEETDGNQWFMPMAASDPASGARLLGASVFYNGSVSDAEKFFAPLLKMQPQALNTTGEKPYPAINTLSDPMAPPMRRYMFGGAKLTLPLDAQLFRDAAEEFYAAVNKPGNEDLRTSMLALEVLSQNVITENGKKDKTSFNGRDGSQNVLLNMAWSDEKLDSSVREIVKRVAGVFRAKTAEDKGEDKSAYLNYLSK
jgi:hypothetical protein